MDGRPKATPIPHASDRVAVVHNGIIENFQALRAELEAAGHAFVTETDTEVVVHLVSEYLNQQMTPQEAVQASLGRLEGAFALAIIFAGRHDLMVGARLGSPLAVGYGEGAMYLGSDALALAPLTDRICYLEEGDWVELSDSGAVVHDATGAEVERAVTQTALSGALIGKGQYRHFMQKEIFEQPAVIGDSLHSFLNPVTLEMQLPALPFDPATLPRLTISACGTAYYAGMVAKYWFEQVARQPVELDIASEFRYPRGPPCPRAAPACSSPNRARPSIRWRRCAMRAARASTSPRWSMCPRAPSPVSPIWCCRPRRARRSASPRPRPSPPSSPCWRVSPSPSGGPAGRLTTRARRRWRRALTEVPARAAEVLNHDEAIQAIAHDLAEARDVLFLGRGSTYPLAMEGALKLKEISYIHAEGYAAGEMKHGPIALIDEAVPVIVCAPSGPLFEKTASNVQEVIARGGRVILISDAHGVDRLRGQCAHAITLPSVDPFVAPLLHAIPVQLLAYHTGRAQGHRRRPAAQPGQERDGGVEGPNMTRTIAVIGGGVVGCSVAWHLAERDLGRVVLLERDRLGSGTTWHSAGNITWKPVEDHDEPVLYAFETLERLARDYEAETGWLWTGRLFLARDKAGLAAFDPLVAAADSQGIEHQRLTPQDAAARHPLLDPGSIAGAWFNSRSGRLNPADLTAAYARAARAHGVEIRQACRVTEIVVERGRVVALETSADRLAVDAVVVCGGLWSRPLLQRLGIELAQSGCEHFYVIARPDPALARETPSFVSVQDLIYGREEVGGFLVGCFDEAARVIDDADLPDPFAFTLLGEDWDKVAPYYERAISLFPALAEAPIRSFVNGPETFTPDGDPLIGPLSGIDGLLVCGAMNSRGVTLSAAAGRIVADTLVEKPQRFDTVRYAPERFGSKAADKTWLQREVSDTPSRSYRQSN